MSSATPPLDQPTDPAALFPAACSANLAPFHRPVGLYEKALPANWSWPQRMAAAAEAGYDYVEICVDESDERLARLRWSSAQCAELRRAVRDAGLRDLTLCLSAHRKYPLGSHSSATRRRSLDIMRCGIDLAVDLNAKIILVEGYDVFYEPHDEGTVARFVEGLQQSAAWAARAAVMLGLENVDVPVTATMTGLLQLIDAVNSPWLQVYADMANLVAMAPSGEGGPPAPPTDPANSPTVIGLQQAHGRLVAVHVKDAIPGVVRGVPFGQGHVPFAAAFSTLDQINFHGPLTVEMWAHLDPAGDPLAAVRQARQLVALFD
jgi:L-ribulose-5-phosphate 3-epimerase